MSYWERLAVRRFLTGTCFLIFFLVFALSYFFLGFLSGFAVLFAVIAVLIFLITISRYSFYKKK